MALWGNLRVKDTNVGVSPHTQTALTDRTRQESSHSAHSFSARIGVPQNSRLL